ncbi:MAG: trimethylamine methyltransferase family protein, partial [Chitinivibrionales bacterium]
IIQSVGPGGHYLYEDHTMKWFRKSFQPTLMERSSYEDWESNGAKTMKDRIIEKTRNLIQNHEGPGSKVPEKVDKEIEKILKEAEKRIANKEKE